MAEHIGRLIHRLKQIGLTETVIMAAWPQWWSDDAATSDSAVTELRFSLARKLGLDPTSLIDEQASPRFVWRDESRFKHLRTENETERAAIASFGAVLGGMLVAAADPGAAVRDISSQELRAGILKEQRFVRLLDLIGFCWSVGIPVAHLRLFPQARKRMSAMSVKVDERNVVLLGKDSMYPAHIAFYLAHEIGHILLGHLSNWKKVL